jgi:nucleoid DNA-binding protein
MTRGELIAALEEECRTDRMKVEDFMNALSDLGAETLVEKGQPFHIGDLGFLVARRRGNRVVVNFQASKNLRERVNKLVHYRLNSF